MKNTTPIFDKTILTSLLFICLSFPCLAADEQSPTSTSDAMVEDTSHRSFASAIKLFHSGRTTEAKTLFKAINDPQSQAYLAEILMQEDIDAAEERIAELQESFPNEARVHFVAGRIMGTQAGQSIFSGMSYAKKSLKAFRTAVSLEPDNIEYRAGLMRFYLNAPSFVGGDEKTAMQQAEKIMTLDTDAGIKALAQVSRSIHDNKEHLDFVRSLTQQYQNNSRAHYEAGLAMQQEKQYDKAFSLLERAMLLARHKTSVDYCLAVYQFSRTALFAQQRLDVAINLLPHYINECEVTHDEMPAIEWAQFRLGNLYELADQPENAQHIYMELTQTQDESLQSELQKKM